MQEARLKYLLNRYAAKSCSEEEWQELEEWYNSLQESDREIEGYEGELFTEEKLSELRERIVKQQPRKAPLYANKTLRRMRYSAAAVVIFLVIGTYFLADNRNNIRLATVAPVAANKITSGSNKAILTLSNGSSIVLDSVQNGVLAKQGAINVLKVDSGVLQYHAGNATGEALYNTLSTPRGGQYQVVLADGTKVWLNAASSLTYPAVFKGSERAVELTGEAYFEVAKNAAMPFVVSTNGIKVQVLGTHFNINSYNDEETTKTTLLEGSVKILNQTRNALLVPGQQAVTTPANDIISVAAVDATDVIAWRYGRTSFKGETVKEIMRRVSRWYDVDVVYQGPISNRTFTGGISRTADISDVLNALKLNGYDYVVSGKIIRIKETP